eukprot:5271115-Prymnesium_polylepis.1
MATHTHFSPQAKCAVAQATAIMQDTGIHAPLPAPRTLVRTHQTAKPVSRYTYPSRSRSRDGYPTLSELEPRQLTPHALASPTHPRGASSAVAAEALRRCARLPHRLPQSSRPGDSAVGRSPVAAARSPASARSPAPARSP